MARREKEGIALRGVAWRASRVKEEEEKAQST